MKNIVIITGSGISQESGIPTFHDAVEPLCYKCDIGNGVTSVAWEKNRNVVIDFFNDMRVELENKQPNSAHRFIKELESDSKYNVNIITQNVDDLHEKSGSKNVLHLHGELKKSKLSSGNNDYNETETYDVCSKNSQVRSHVVLFDENVPKMGETNLIIDKADILIIIGSSLDDYHVAGIFDKAINNRCEIYIINPGEISIIGDYKHIKEKAIKGCRILSKII